MQPAKILDGSVIFSGFRFGSLGSAHRDTTPGVVSDQMLTKHLNWVLSHLIEPSAFWLSLRKPAYQPRDPTQVADFRGSDGGSGRMAAISPITRGESTAAAKIVLLDQWV